METIKGSVSGIIYQNDESGYRVVDVELDDGDFATVTGTMPPLFAGEIIEAEGDWTDHPVYGPQFKATAVGLSLPTTTEGMGAFLSSGLIPGIGPVLASKIIKKFGNDTFDVIAEEPERLEDVSGITLNKVRRIKEAFEKHKASSSTVIFFADFGVGTGVAIEAYRRFGDDVRNIVEGNPYALIGSIHGYGFGTADRIARQLGLPENSPQRVQAYILHVLGESCGEGHVFLTEESLFETVSGSIEGFSRDEFREALDSLAKDKNIERVSLAGPEGDVKAVYLKELYDAERGIEIKLRQLGSFPHRDGTSRVDKLIKLFEKENGIKLDDMQTQAVKTAAESGVCVITGGPGTGKTTIIKAVMRILSDKKVKTVLCAPTGRAAKRMSDACGEKAKTIHRLLEPDFTGLSPEDIKDGDTDRRFIFKHHAGNPLDCGCIIVDEMSMVDTALMFRLVDALRAGTRLVMVGDNNQLPSVGPGRVLRDIISSEEFPVIRLENIYRQDPDSLISYNAYLVNNGKMPEMNKERGDFFRITVRTPRECIELLKSLVSKRLPEKYGIDPFADIQVITPNRKGQCGSQNFSAEIQSVLNPPPEKGKTEIKNFGESFRVGDRVMHTKNDYELEWEDYDDPVVCGTGVFNGEMGTIRQIDTKNRLVYVLFGDNRHVCYDSQSIAELELCYAITVHKSQGSEFDYCIIPICGVTPQLKTRNLLYTAITRAKKMAIILGTDEDLARMIENNGEIRRNTTLFKRGTYS